MRGGSTAKTIFCVSMGRAGSHALSGWVRSQLPCDTPFIYNYGTCKLKLFHDFFKPMNKPSVLHQECVKIDRLVEISKKLNIQLDSITDKQIVYGWRDPWNHFASLIAFWIQKHKRKGDGKTLEDFIIAIKELYIPNHKNILKNVLGIQKFLPSSAIFWQYDRWFLEPEYRKKLSHELDLASFKKGVNTVWKSSSFDSLEQYSEGAQKFKVRDRWRYYIELPEYRQLFEDKKLVELSSQFYEPPF